MMSEDTVNMNEKREEQFVDLDNAREPDQKVVMQEIQAEDHCPFCLENLEKYHKRPILKEGEYWLLTDNQWPYKHTSVHLLLIYKEHATTLSELDPLAGIELLEFVQWAEAEFKVPGGGWSMRFGDTNYSAGTVNHIHVQFLQPNLKSEGYEPVRIKIGKRFK